MVLKDIVDMRVVLENKGELVIVVNKVKLERMGVKVIRVI
jgi:hypothetical protein